MVGNANNSSRQVIRAVFSGPQALAFVPAITLGSFWIGGEAALLGIAIILPIIIAALGGIGETSLSQSQDGLTGLGLRESVEDSLERTLQSSQHSGHTTAGIVLALDDYDALIKRLGHKTCDDVLRRTGDRLRDVMRDHDVIARLDGATFAIALAPVQRADLETLIQISNRIQSAVSEPISHNKTVVYVSCSVGFCLSSRAPSSTGEAILEAAEHALTEAQANGTSTIRGYTAQMQSKSKAKHILLDEVGIALENGQIIPWFQPQVSTDTGEITGFEALARWCHPERGMIPPSDFLPAIEQAGLYERLGEVMTYQSLTSLKKWDEAGAMVPMIAVNFSSAELRNPNLVDKVRWELDRFDLTPNRLTIEVLEHVVANAGDEVITHNIAGLATLGCAIDLDDFGVGHASIASIRQFAIGRIKIDRSFITKVDIDSEQQRMVSAILTMAEQLNIETLGEGVETVGEHAMLAQLGCGHIQGFGLARPMPFADTLEWMQKHRGKLAKAPKIGRRTG